MKYLFLCALLVFEFVAVVGGKAQTKVLSSKNYGISELKTNVLLPLDKDFELSFSFLYSSEADKGSIYTAFINPKNAWTSFPKFEVDKLPISMFEIDNYYDEANVDALYPHADNLDIFSVKHRTKGNLPIINLKPVGEYNHLVIKWIKCEEQILLYVNGELKISGRQNLQWHLNAREAALVIWIQAGSGNLELTLKDLQLKVSEPKKREVNLGPDFYFTGSPVRLDAGDKFDSYLWNTGGKSRYAAAMNAGTYWVTAKSGNGCESSDTIVLHKSGAPNAEKLIALSTVVKEQNIEGKSKITVIPLSGFEVPPVADTPELSIKMVYERELNDSISLKRLELAKLDSVGKESLIAISGILDQMFDKSVTDSVVKTTESTGGYVLKNVNFMRGSSKLLPESFEELNRLAEFLKLYPHLKVRIMGHTDTSGDAYLNMELSENRANSVRMYLFDQGVKYARIETKGFGSSKPLGNYTPGLGKNPNMRVEFEIFE